MREEVNNRQEVESEIDLQEMLFSYLHHWWVIALCVLAFVGMAMAYTNLFVTPLYRASVTIYVNNSINTNVEYIASTDLSVSQKLVDTYVNIITSDTVLNKVAEEKQLPYSAGQLRSMLTAEQVDKTEIFKVFVSNPSPQMAAKIADAIADVAPGEIRNFVEGSSTKIIDYAKVPTSPYSPNYVKNAAIGFLAGAFVAIAYLTIRYLLDVHVNDAEDLERMFEYPVLGQIPDIMLVRSKTRGAYAKYAEEAGGESK
ncbi:MAG: hypothetical protein J6J43_08685 [Oscillospiraceae bacterium]|nr:hypothetical protein [Oscillospiraceae bacterium]